MQRYLRLGKQTKEGFGVFMSKARWTKMKKHILAQKVWNIMSEDILVEYSRITKRFCKLFSAQRQKIFLRFFNKTKRIQNSKSLIWLWFLLHFWTFHASLLEKCFGNFRPLSDVFRPKFLGCNVQKTIVASVASDGAFLSNHSDY